MRLRAVAVVAGVVAGVAAGLVGMARCQRGGGGARTGEVRLHLEADPPHLNPLVAADLGTQRVTLGDVYEPLWSVAPDGTLVGELAESWWRSPDDTDWIVTLREGVTWHDGKPFSADDVVFTYGILGPDGEAVPLAADFDDLVLVEARDRRTVHFQWKRYRVGRDRSISHVPILARHVYAGTALAHHPANASPVGTGPYRFARWEAGRAIVLVRNPRHRAPPRIERVVYRVIADRTQALAQLRGGELDAMLQAPGSELEALGADRRFVLVPWDAQTFTAVAWNCQRIPDARTRHALAMTLDRETVIREIYKGRGKLLSGPWLPGSPAYDEKVLPPPFDVDAARASVTGPLTVKLLLPQESRVLERIATIWQEDAKRAGITLVLESAPWAEVLRRARAGDFDGVAMSWTTAPEQDFHHRFHSGAADNWGRCADPETDALLETIRVDAERSTRQLREWKLHERLHTQQYVTFVSADVRVAAVSRRLGGVRLDADALLPARTLTFVGAAK